MSGRGEGAQAPAVTYICSSTACPAPEGSEPLERSSSWKQGGGSRQEEEGQWCTQVSG